MITHHFHTNEITPKWEILIYFKNLLVTDIMLKVHSKGHTKVHAKKCTFVTITMQLKDPNL